jgi:ribosomal protein S18 acetylase RimI-like enzyme
MHYRNAERTDIAALAKLYREVASKSGMIARKEHEVTTEFVEAFVDKSLRDGLIIVGEDEAQPGELIAEIHASKPGIELLGHIFSDLTILVDPRYQDKGIGRTIFTIFLDEIANHRPDVGRVELLTAESNKRALHLYQSLGFVIEGRFEMRLRTATGFEADIALSWQNPGFEFDGEIPRVLNRP